MSEKIDFYSLYLRNAKGVLNAIVETARIDADGLQSLFVLIELIVLPITITLGALLKSIVDYSTREPLSQDKFSNTLGKLNKMAGHEIEALSKHIIHIHPNPKSKSSVALLEELKSSVDESKISAAVDSAAREAKVKQENKTINLKAQEIIELSKKEGFDIKVQVTQVVFLQPELEGIAKQKQATIDTEKKANLLRKKNALTLFFKSEHNTGKRMQQVIAEKLVEIQAPASLVS